MWGSADRWVPATLVSHWRAHACASRAPNEPGEHGDPRRSRRSAGMVSFRVAQRMQPLRVLLPDVGQAPSFEIVLNVSGGDPPVIEPTQKIWPPNGPSGAVTRRAQFCSPSVVRAIRR